MKKSSIRLAIGAFLVAAFGASTVVGCADDDGSKGFTAGDDLILTIEPSQVVFSNVNVGQSAARDVRVRHVGLSGVIRIRNLRLETDSTDLVLEAPTSVDLKPGEAATFAVTYTPTDTASDSGEVVFETNVPTAEGAARVGRVPVITLAQGGILRATPALVDFGAVEAGALAPRTVGLINVGQEFVEITKIGFSAGSSPDFSMTEVPTLPYKLGPDESLQVKLGYVPVGGGSDEGSLEVQFTLNGETRELSPPVSVLGREVGPRIDAFPNPVDFGLRATGRTHTIPLTLSNQGERNLIFADLAFVAGSSDTVAITGFAGAGTIVAPGAVLPLSLTFTPTTSMVQTTGPIARLRATTNDPSDDGQYDILIFGRAEVPILQVNPPDILDFGFVPQNVGRDRSLALFNAGNAPLDVSALRLTDDSGGEFELVADPGWGPTTVPARADQLVGLASQQVSVRFTNSGADTGVAWGKLIIDSNDGVTPAWEITLKAQRAGAPSCEINLVPTQRDFGIVARGARRTMTFNIVNVGSGDCSFHSALVNGCSSFLGFFQGSCADPRSTIEADGRSPYYRVTRTPFGFQNGLRAGQSYELDVTFTPPDSAPVFGDEFTSYAGILGVRVIDPNSGSNDPITFPKPVVGGFSQFPPNLAARSGIAQLAVLPGQVDFGLTTIGCHSRTVEVTAYNVGSAPLDVTDIKLDGCSVEYRVKSSPGLPLSLGVNGSTVVELVYVPQDLGSDSCGLAFYTNGEQAPTVVVPLSGEGTFETKHTDNYVQTTGQDVDVLFVVDNSGSMSSNQSNLANNFQSFTASAAQWNNNYHIGVTTTDMDAEAGALVRAAGNARFVTRTTTQQLSQNFRVGTNGSADEKGLAAAQSALSLPLTANSQTVCTQDAQCQASERCVEGFCGGRNRAFLREDAALEIVLVSDEEDSSPGDLNFYINFFRSIKGVFNTNMMHVHAIVGDVPGGCQTSSGSAVAGRRYVDVANATGGSVISICDSNFSAGLASIGAIAFGLRRQFYLTRTPVPTTIKVTVNGRACTASSGSNWMYDENSNSVVFDEAGGCMPTEGQTVKIDYDTLCFLE